MEDQTRLVPPTTEKVEDGEIAEAFSLSNNIQRNENGVVTEQVSANGDQIAIQMQNKTIHNLEMERDALKSELEHQVNRAKYFETRAISYRDALINLCNEIGGND